MIQPGVSIMICCHNGASRLAETLKYIAQQDVPSYIPWEVIIVDNKSTDYSAMTARIEWAKYRLNARFRVVLETKLGLSNARARGFKEAQYDYVLMCDDDNWLAPDYVSTVYRIMFEKPNIGALGGLGTLVFELKPPGYIEYSNIFAAGEQAPEPGKVPGYRIYGAGCVIRKSAYQRLHEIGFQSLLVDRKGRQLSSGGDYELCYALYILGYDIWYDDQLRFKHYITRERLNWDYFMRYAKESAECFEVLSSYHAIADDMLINKLTLGHIARNAFYTFRRFIRINTKRLFAKKNSDEARMLYFRHYVLSYKLRAYMIRFNEMIRIHEKIFEFRDKCQALRQKEKLTERKLYSPAFQITSFSKPSQQLQ